MSSSLTWLLPSASAGLLGAGAAIFTKTGLVRDPARVRDAWERTARALGLGDALARVDEESLLPLLRGASLALVILCNVLMWLQFTRALNRAPSTVHASLVNSGANFVGTALFSKMIFDDPLPLLWWIGSSLILAGMVLMNRRAQVAEKKKD